MGKRNIALYIGLGLLGAAGAAAGVSAVKKRRAAGGKPEAKAPEKPDTPPGMISCASCGAKYKEYEFFCPSCKAPAPGA